MRTLFTAEVRALLCEQCGAPLESPLAGGHIVCTYCRTTNAVGMRDERPTLGMPAVVRVDEATRLARLRAQDGRPLVPPASLAGLFAGGGLEPWKVQEAFTVWQQSRRELRMTSSPDAAERVYFLTLALANVLVAQNDWARVRALVESALDAVSLPRHKQALRGMLARYAAREGDLGSAERWLAPCDPAADDLESDSSFRVARAYVDTCGRNYPNVLAMLGASDDAVPIADLFDPMAAVLRANAMERLGQLEPAVQALRSRMAKESVGGRDAIEKFVAANPQLQLCPGSLPMAKQGFTQAAAKSVASGQGSGVGLVFLIVGIGSLVFGFGLAAVIAFTVTPSAGIFPLFGTLPLGLIFMGVGGSMYFGGREAAYVREHGLVANATVLALRGTGMRVNNVPMMEMVLRVELDGREPYEASVRQLATAGMHAAGTRLRVRVHPQKPKVLVIET